MLQNKTKRNAIMLTLITFCFMIFSCFSMLTVSAEEIDNSLVAPIAQEETSETIAPNTNNSNSTLDADQGLPSTTVRQIQSKVNEKGFDIVRVLQTFGKPFCIICFIVGLVYLIVACLSKTGSVGKALLALVLIAAVYGLIAAAPEIVQWTSNWMQS